MKVFLLGFLFTIFLEQAQAQLYFKNTLKANQEITHRNLVQNTINKNLASPVNTEYEEDWMSAYTALEVLQYKSSWVKSRIDSAAEYMHLLSIPFQRATLELLFSNYQNLYYQPVKLLLMQTQDAKIFAMCAEYILASDKAVEDINFLKVKTQQLSASNADNPILQQLQYRLENAFAKRSYPNLSPLFSQNFLSGKNIVYSFQRKNRDYPGLVLIRDSNGNLVKDSMGGIFNVPQLARSITNLPGYLTNGNTPQGIFSMQGNDVSRSIFIGPTVNIQMGMPYEISTQKYFYNTSLDSEWTLIKYKNLLPAALQNYEPLYQSYYAGKAGRTDIIIHGSTLNPNYYSGTTYFPLTPTMGCLTSKEVWDENTGKRTFSDQQKIINAFIPLGFRNGYAIVIEINDEEKPVSLADLAQYLP